MSKCSVVSQQNEWAAHDYGNIFFRQPMSSGERLVIGPSSKQVETMLDLARTWPTQQFYVLYVLLISRTGSESGRYQSPLIESFEDLKVFLYTYEGFLESDGRHHIWIGSPTNDGVLVYDQHNVIFAYGDLAEYEQSLALHGYSHGEFWFPAPHSHSFLPENDREEEALLKHFEWQHSPLQAGDEWD